MKRRRQLPVFNALSIIFTGVNNTYAPAEIWNMSHDIVTHSVWQTVHDMQMTYLFKSLNPLNTDL